MTGQNIRVAVVDDHAVVREGIRRVLEGEPGVTVVGEGKNAAEALALVASETPDVLVMDVAMPGRTGLSVAAELHRHSSATKVLILSMYDQPEYVLESVKAGARGYLLKDSPPAELRRAVRAVFEGEQYFPPTIAARLSAAMRSDAPAPLALLTPRERDVLVGVTRGETNKQIAAALGISPRTVETHRESLMDKLEIRTVAGLTKLAIDAGLLCLFLALGASALPAQTRPTIILDKGAWEYPESFSKLTQLVELRDGRILLLDTEESTLLLVDPKRNSSSPVSRKGGGPLEYQFPGLLLGSAPDTLLYLDMMQQRFLLLSSTAIPLGTARFGSGANEARLAEMMPSTTDARGRAYGVTTGFAVVEPSGKSRVMPTIADTVEVQRLDRKSGKTTTLTRVRNPISQSKPRVEMSGTGVKMTLTAPNFFPTDAWAALPDGRVAVLRDGIYQVRFVTEAGTETLGPVVPYVKIPVTATERKMVMDSMRTAMNKMLSGQERAMGAAGGKAGPKLEAEVLEPATWAAFKPAYIELLSSPDGRLWVTLSRPADTRSTRLDLLSGTGALLAHIELASGESVIGLGRGTVYTVRKDDDDLQYLKRYTLPPLK